MIVTAILAWLHIISAVLWLGGGVLFAYVVAPSLSRLTPPGPGEFFVKIVPRVSMFFRIVAGTTILFGLLLFLVGTSAGDFSAYSLSSAWGVSITIGFVFGLIAFLNSEFIAQPPLKRAIGLFRKMAQSQGPPAPPAELPKTLRSVAVTGRVTVILLLVSFTFMIAAGYL